MSETKKEKSLLLKVLCSKAFIITFTVLLGIVVGLTVIGIDTQSSLKTNLFPFLNGELVANIYKALSIVKVTLGRGYIFVYFTLILMMYIIVIGTVFSRKIINKLVSNKGDAFKSKKAAKGFMYFVYYLMLAFICIILITIINLIGKYNDIGTYKAYTAQSVLKIIGLYIAFVVIIFFIIILIMYIVNSIKKKKKNDTQEETSVEVAEEVNEEPVKDAEEPVEEETDSEQTDDSVVVGDIEGKEIERLSRSFFGKLCQVRHEVKDAYDDIRAELLSFKKVNARLSWSSENFNLGRKKVAKIDVRGKALILYLALDPATLDAKYHAKDKSEVKRFAETPAMVKVRSNRGLKFAIELIDEMLKDVVKKDNYVPEKVSHTLKTDKELLELGLAKKVKSKF